MVINSHEKRAYRRAVLETVVEEECKVYKLDEFGEIVLDENGDPEYDTIKRKNKVKIPFRYNYVNQGFLQKQQAIGNFYVGSGEFVIYTNGKLPGTPNDRIILAGKVYTIKDLTYDYNDSTAAMFNEGGACVTYITLTGGDV